MKLSDFMKQLAGVEGAKPILATFQAEIGDLPDMDLKDYGTQIKKANADAVQLADLTKTVKELDVKVKEAEPLRTKVATYEKTIGDGLLKTEFTSRALAAGVKKEGIDAAFALANLGGAKVDLERKQVTGVTQDIFDALKTSQAFLFAPASTTKEPIPALPSSGQTTQEHQTIQPNPGGWMGHFMKAAELAAAVKN